MRYENFRNEEIGSAYAFRNENRRKDTWLLRYTQQIVRFMENSVCNLHFTISTICKNL